MNDHRLSNHYPLPSSRREWALFLDFDGTLTPLVDHPDHVTVDDDLRTLLDSLADRLDGALAIVSGRSIADLDHHLSPLRLACGGQHGAELRDGHGQHRSAGDDERLQGVRERLHQFAEQHPGIVIEDKGASLAVHYRNAPALADTVTALTQAIIERLGDDFERHPGKAVIEIKPSGYHKGLTVATFMAEAPFSGRVPVFIGDDVTDEDGFEAVSSRNGIAIKVGEGPTRAHYRLEADEVHEWLRDCLAAMRD